MMTALVATGVHPLDAMRTLHAVLGDDVTSTVADFLACVDSCGLEGMDRLLALGGAWGPWGAQ